MSVRRSMALTVARTAISIVLPGGAAVSGGFAVGELRRHGVDVASATAMTVLAGAQSIAAIAVVYLVWFATVGVATAGGSGLTGVAYATGLVAVAVGAMSGGRRLLARRTGARRVGDERRAGPVRRRADALLRLAADTARNAASLSTKDWAAGGAYAMANWVFDLACLLATAHAFGLRVGTIAIVGAYLAIQLVRQIPVTPGGIGVVEAGLIVALVAVGATGGIAAAVVLTYRILSCWLLVPIGLGAWLGLQAGNRAGPATERPVDRPAERRPVMPRAG
jgi:uncharacterized protein (TIRG00374 family)